MKSCFPKYASVDKVSLAHFQNGKKINHVSSVSATNLVCGRCGVLAMLKPSTYLLTDLLESMPLNCSICE